MFGQAAGETVIHPLCQEEGRGVLQRAHRLWRELAQGDKPPWGPQSDVRNH